MDQPHEQPKARRRLDNETNSSDAESSQCTAPGVKRPPTGSVSAEEDGKKRQQRTAAEDDRAAAAAVVTPPNDLHRVEADTPRSKAPAAAAEKNVGQKRQRTEEPSAVAASSDHERRVQATPATLFSDGLHIVFSFLDDREWLAEQAWLSCRSWYAAALSMRSRRQQATVSNRAAASALNVSSLAYRHVTRLCLDGTGSCPKVTRSLAESQAILKAVCTGQLQSRLTEMQFKGPWHQSTSLAPIMQLPNLESLAGQDFSDEQMQVVKQLSQLRRLKLNSLGARSTAIDQVIERSLVDLLLPPHSLHQLVDLEVTHSFHAETMQLLVGQLPQLTRLISTYIEPHCMPSIGRLKHLHEVTLLVRDTCLFRHWIAPHLVAFGQLRTLEIGWCIFENQKQVAQFAAAMPLLESLRLYRCEGITYSSLCRLLTLCTRVSRLVMHRSFNQPAGWLTEDEVDSLSTPSALFPQLQHFEASKR